MLPLSLLLLLTLALPISAHEGVHESLALLQTQIQANPENPDIYLRQAELLIEHQEPESALDSITRAEKLAPPTPASHLLRAHALILAKSPDQATALLDPLIATHPNHIPALTLRAKAHRDSLHLKLAILDCRTLLKLRPDPDIAFLATDLLIATNQSAAAISLLDSSFPAHPASTDLRALEIEASLKDWSAAHRRIDRRIANATRPEPEIARKAELYTQADMPDQAISTWKLLAAKIQQLPSEIRVSPSLKFLSEKANQAIHTTTP